MSTAAVLDEESARSGGPLRAPYPYFGGKRKVAQLVWDRLGNDLQVYVEPFAGSLAVLLGRPGSYRGLMETVGDFDGLIANVWRSIKHDPMAVAYYASDLVSEVDLHARHAWLLRCRTDLVERLLADPDFYDAKAAGWWIWGQASFIGGGWCQGAGSWQVVDGYLQKIREGDKKGSDDHGLTRRKGMPIPRRSEAAEQMAGLPAEGVNLSIPHLGSGRGVHRPTDADISSGGFDLKIPLAGSGRGIHRPADTPIEGINTSLPHMGAPQGVHRPAVPGSPALDDWGRYPGEGECINIVQWMGALSERLRRVRICCGDWERTLGSGGTTTQGVTGVFLDPPYDPDGRQGTVYYHDADDVWTRARNWAAKNGENPMFRIALCGYSAHPHEAMPAGWTVIEWKANGGYGNADKGHMAIKVDENNRALFGSQGGKLGQGRVNAGRECMWFSPSCKDTFQEAMFSRDGSIRLSHLVNPDEPEAEAEDTEPFVPISIHTDAPEEEPVEDPVEGPQIEEQAAPPVSAITIPFVRPDPVPTDPAPPLDAPDPVAALDDPTKVAQVSLW